MELQDDGGKLLTLTPSETAVTGCFQTKLCLHSQDLFLVCPRWPVDVSCFLVCRRNGCLWISVLCDPKKVMFVSHSKRWHG